MAVECMLLHHATALAVLAASSAGCSCDLVAGGLVGLAWIPRQRSYPYPYEGWYEPVLIVHRLCSRGTFLCVRVCGVGGVAVWWVLVVVGEGLQPCYRAGTSQCGCCRGCECVAVSTAVQQDCRI